MARRSSTSGPPAFTAAMRIVILRGPDAYLQRSHRAALKAALDAEHGEIAVFPFDGRSTPPATILDELRSFGLMHAHKLVVVTDADQLLTEKGKSADAAPPAPPRSAAGKGKKQRGPRSARDLFESYAAAPVPTATLLLQASAWRPGRLDKAVEKVGAIVKCEPPDEGSAQRWAQARCAKAYDVELPVAAARTLVSRIGPNLDRLDQELAKLAAHVGGRGASSITPDDVATMVGLSREEKAWAIQSVLLSGDTARTTTKLRELADVSGQPEQLILWSITDLLRKLHAASRLIRQGETAGSIRKSLRLFGGGGDAVIARAKQLDPADCARLLADAIHADRRTKRGIGRTDRTIESLVVSVADTMK